MTVEFDQLRVIVVEDDVSQRQLAVRYIAPVPLPAKRIDLSYAPPIAASARRRSASASSAAHNAPEVIRVVVTAALNAAVRIAFMLASCFAQTGSRR